METLKAAIAAALLLAGAAAATAEPMRVAQLYAGTNGVYEIVFEYDDALPYVPTAFPAQVPHYRAYVTVSRVDGARRRQIGNTFRGIYTAGKCYEDEPAALVIMAESGIW